MEKTMNYQERRDTEEKLRKLAEASGGTAKLPKPLKLTLLTRTDCKPYKCVVHAVGPYGVATDGQWPHDAEVPYVFVPQKALRSLAKALGAAPEQGGDARTVWMAEAEELFLGGYGLGPEEWRERADRHEPWKHGETPIQFVDWFAGKYGLEHASEYGLGHIQGRGAA